MRFALALRDQRFAPMVATALFPWMLITGRTRLR
jgi:hypothetical protein